MKYHLKILFFYKILAKLQSESNTTEGSPLGRSKMEHAGMVQRWVLDIK